MRTIPMSTSTSKQRLKWISWVQNKSNKESVQTGRKCRKKGTATKLVISSMLSTRKAAKVSQQLSQDTITVEIPS